MPNEASREAHSRQLRDDQRRAAEAAQKFRRRIRSGEYSGLPGTAVDDLLYLAALVDSAGAELADLPARTRSDLLHAVRRLLDDGPKLGASDPITSGDGH